MMSARSRASGLALIAAWVAGGCGSAEEPVTVADAVVPAEYSCAIPSVLAALPAPLYEASGITRDPRRADLFWVHNDSGNDPEIYAIDTTGTLLSTVALEGATSRDLEDIALGPCPSGDCLYLGDIGDNRGVYPFVTVHRLPLPSLPADSGSAPGGPLRPEVSWRLVYEGGPRDAESLAVDGDRSELLIVTKGRDGEIGLYAASLGSLGAGSEPDTLRRIGSLAVPIGATTGQFVTAADLSPDGGTLAIRSYTTLYLFPWAGSARFDTTSTPAWVSLVSALEAQGEGLSWDVDGSSLVLVSEGRGGRPPSLSSVRCPQT